MSSSISVVIPTYNSALYLSAAINSALNQTLAPDEIIVVNDGSTDNTDEILKAYQSKIIHISQKNSGRSAARNRGISNAKSKYVAFLDADDAWYETKLERQMDSWSLHQGAGWSYCRTRLVTENDLPLDSSFWPETFGTGRPGAHNISEEILLGSFEISTSTVIVERRLFNQVGYFSKRLKSAEDTNMWLRMAVQCEVMYLPEVLSTRRINTNVTFQDRFIDYDYAKFGPDYLLDAMGRSEIDAIHLSVAKSSLEKAYLISAFTLYAGGEIQRGREYWDKAAHLSKTEDIENLIINLLPYFSISASRYSQDGPSTAERILLLIFESLPISRQRKKELSPSVRAELYSVVAYMYHKKKETTLARKFGIKALVCQPKRIQDLGLLKRSFLSRKYNE